jgi:hypothetical protein
MVTHKIIEGMDQSAFIVTAILRLAEIEKSQRLASFDKVVHRIVVIVATIGVVRHAAVVPRAARFQPDKPGKPECFISGDLP